MGIVHNEVVFLILCFTCANCHAVSSIDDVDNNILVGTCIGIAVMIICIFALIIKIQKRKLAKEKDIFFKQNGGHILY